MENHRLGAGNKANSALACLFAARGCGCGANRFRIKGISDCCTYLWASVKGNCLLRQVLCQHVSYSHIRRGIQEQKGVASRDLQGSNCCWGCREGQAGGSREVEAGIAVPSRNFQLMKHQLDSVTTQEWVLKKYMVCSAFLKQLRLFGQQNWI